jgi:DNA repair protein SbcD/Mre11
VVLISGNHDSARRLGVNSALIDTAGVHLRTRPEALADPVLLDDEHGQVAVYGIPYLEPALGLPGPVPGAAAALPCTPSVPGTPAVPCAPVVPNVPAVPGAGAAAVTRSHACVLGAAVGLIRADVAARGADRTVVLAHAWVAGGRSDAERADSARRQASASERDISVGGIGYAPAGLFDGFGYVALGHLHGRQVLASHLRYAGSPLPYSFSEKDHEKGSWLVEVGADGAARAEWVPAPVYRRLAVLSGRLESLLAAPEHDRHAGDFLAVTLTDIARPEGAMERLRRRFPHILTLEFKPEGLRPDERSYRQRVSGRDDLAVAAEFVRHVRSSDPSGHERELLGAAFTAVRRAAAGER